MTLLASSIGVDSGSGSAGGTPFPKAKVWQVTQKQKTVDDLVSVVIDCNLVSLSNNAHLLFVINQSINQITSMISDQN